MDSWSTCAQRIENIKSFHDFALRYRFKHRVSNSDDRARSRIAKRKACESLCVVCVRSNSFCTAKRTRSLCLQHLQVCAAAPPRQSRGACAQGQPHALRCAPPVCGHCPLSNAIPKHLRAPALIFFMVDILRCLLFCPGTSKRPSSVPASCKTTRSIPFS